MGTRTNGHYEQMSTLGPMDIWDKRQGSQPKMVKKPENTGGQKVTTGGLYQGSGGKWAIIAVGFAPSY